MSTATSTPFLLPDLPPPVPEADAAQRVIKIRRDYNAWVASETLEDYALRFTPRSFRKWSEWRVANTAFGAASFLVLEAVGATLLVQVGFVNAFWAIVATGLVIFVAGLPISVYAARYGVDMDLLTRGAGFGYIGSTITSLIYASFTFVFFALEAAVMAYALDLAFGIPPTWGYLVCALVVIPLVTHGVTMISRLQVWTQPLWLAMLVLPYIAVFHANPHVLTELRQYGGEHGIHGFDLTAFGAAMTVGIALITQMGEQVDYLRFMPERMPERRMRWWAAVLAGGPGWVLLGVVKMLGGALLAYLAIRNLVPVDRAVDPNQMYLAAYGYVLPHAGWAVAATALFVIVSQLKINVTNAYAGSLAWSNFFSRLTHSHPGRVVWVVFNTAIALMLMELDVFQALGGVLGLYSNLAISWMMAVVADLVVNKPLGLSPPGIEFKRAHLYDVNPVGVGAMGAASVLSIAAHLGAFGAMAQAFSALIALVTAFVASPLIAWATRGRYYLARKPEPLVRQDLGNMPEAGRAPGRSQAGPHPLGGSTGVPDGRGAVMTSRCCICERDYEGDDMAHCPAYAGPICSLCCTLDARCGDQCKPQPGLLKSLWARWAALLARVLPRRMASQIDTGLGAYLLLMLAVLPLLAGLFGLLYHQLDVQQQRLLGTQAALLTPALEAGFVKAYAALALVAAIAAWWLVLAHGSRKVAMEEARRQTQALHAQTQTLRTEIESHRRTDLQLQDAKLQAEAAQHQAEAARGQAEAARRQADLANQAKSRYITTISHELRTPLNSILGYAQLLEDDAAMPPKRRQAVGVIRRGGDHLLSLIEGTLDIAHIEGGKLKLDAKPMRFRETVQEIARLFELQAADKGIAFVHEAAGKLPELVRTDEKRLRQILINVVGNAVKFTRAGQVRFAVQYAREIARFEIADTGPGMAAAELERVFEPFVRGSSAGAAAAGGSGLGLTIAKMLTDLMGGELTVDSTEGVGTTFRIRLFLPEVHTGQGAPSMQLPAPVLGALRCGYDGPRRRILVVDNEEVDRGLLVHVLEPLGFEIVQAASGEDCLALLRSTPAQAQPDAIFMDLAMPGIDGWATIAALRAEGLSSAPVAIVSANAFDRRLDNAVGIAPSDFIVKPVRVAELLDWLGRRLGLTWRHAEQAVAPVPAPIPSEPAPMVRPSAPRLRALEDVLALGYYRGIVQQLDAIDADEPQCAALTGRLRALAREFQFEAMSNILQQARDAQPGA